MPQRRLSCSLSIVIPAFNEKKGLAQVVPQLYVELEQYISDYEVIVVDDGSTDETPSVLDELIVAFPDLVVKTLPNNMGYGFALMRGIELSTKEFVAYVPADGQFSVADMRHCFEVLEGSDLVLGYRGGRSDYTFQRILLSYGYLIFLFLLFRLRYSDVGWVHIWRTQAIRPLRLEGDRGIFILTEIIIRLKRCGAVISEAPSYYHPRVSGEPKNTKFIVIMKTIRSAISLYWHTRHDAK